MNKIKLAILIPSAVIFLYVFSSNMYLKSEKMRLERYNLSIEAKVSKLSADLAAKENQLIGLKNVESIKKALNNAQGTVDELSRELTRVNNERAVLQEQNSGLKSRYDNINREFLRATDELEQIKSEIPRTGKGASRKRIDEVSRVDYTNISDDSQLKKELKELQDNYNGLVDNNKSLNNKISSLEVEKSNLQDKLSVLQNDINQQDNPMRALQDKIVKLNSSLTEKQEQVSIMESELVRLNSLNVSQKKQLALHQDTISSLEQVNKNFKIQISQMTDDLSRRKQELDIQKNQMQPVKSESFKLQSRITSLEDELRIAKQEIKDLDVFKIEKATFEDRLKQIQQEVEKNKLTIDSLQEEKLKLNAELNKLKVRKTVDSVYNVQDDNIKEQLTQLSGVLLRKELEIEKAKRESVESTDKVISLQTKIADLEKSLTLSKISQERIRELETQKFGLQSKLSEAEEELDKKVEVIDSLQKNMEYLNIQLSRKEDERKGIENKLTQLESLKSTTQDALEKQKSHIAEVDILYNSLRSQVSQLADMIKQKDDELNQKRKEIFSLKEDLVSIKSRSMQLEQDLADTKDRQRKTIDDLSSAVKLNSMLQQKLSTGVIEPSTKDKLDAEELRRRVEVILEPEK